MRQLAGQDATYIYGEAPRQPLHVTGLAVYDPSTAEGGQVRFKQILEHVRSRLHTTPSFRERLVRVPLDVDYPWWINDPHFDLEFHVRHLALPHPGDWRQLCIQAARLHSRALDMNRPVWELYVVEGVDGVGNVPEGSYAILSKFHHSAIDGATGTEISAGLHDLEPDASGIAPPTGNWHADRPPSDLELLSRTFGNNIRQPFRLARVLSKAVPQIADARRRLRTEELRSAGEVPRTIFNARVSPHRVFDAREFALEDIKRIRKAVPGATVNDAVISICGGALRKYLLHRDALPEKSLISAAPINVRTEAERGKGGNQVSSMFVAIRTDIEHPLERFNAVFEHTRDAKELTNAMGARLMTDINQHIPSATLALAGRLIGRMGLATAMAPQANLSISNVPGPQVPLYMNGAQMVTQYGMGPVTDAFGLFMVVLSYNGRLTISFSSCREMVPDPGYLAECIQESFDETRAAADSALAE